MACLKDSVNILTCSLCDSGCYCSTECRDGHVQTYDHRILCASIQHLEKVKMEKRLSALPLREKTQVRLKRRLVSLMGEKPIVNCKLNNKNIEALWDTGAMVSMVDRKWLEKNNPEAEIKTLEEFLDGDTLHLFTANNSKVSIEGVATMNFQIGDISIPVPFVVCKDPVLQPIIGFNVIKHLIFEGGEGSGELLRMSCPSILAANISAVIQLVRNEVQREDWVVTTKSVHVPANSRCKIKCSTRYRASEPVESVMFTPNPMDSELVFSESIIRAKLGRGHVSVVVQNPTNSEIVLDKGVTLGSIEIVSAVIPLMPREEPNPVHIDSVQTSEKVGDGWLPPVDLSHLAEDQRV